MRVTIVAVKGLARVNEGAGGSGRVDLQYRVPAGDLQPYVTLFYHFTADVPVFDDMERADHAQFRFRLSAGASRYRFADGNEQDAAPAHVIGPSSGAFRTFAHGPVEVIGMGLQPAGWAALVGLDASAMVDRVVDAGELFRPAALVDAMARVRAVPGTDAKVAVAEDLVRRSLARRSDDALSFSRAIDAWIADSRAPELDALVDACGLSRRQVERRVKALYGVPPKVLARKYRALRAAVEIAEGCDVPQALSAGGFYDQSHLIRELKQFTGLTPRQLRDSPGLLQQLTMSGRRGLGGQVSVVISDT